jgi:hypothetical protein
MNATKAVDVARADTALCAHLQVRLRGEQGTPYEWVRTRARLLYHLGHETVLMNDALVAYPLLVAAMEAARDLDVRVSDLREQHAILGEILQAATSYDDDDDVMRTRFRALADECLRRIDDIALDVVCGGEE